MADLFKAKWILTAAENGSDIELLYEDCALETQNGKILDIIPQSEINEENYEFVEDFGSAVITPGFFDLDAKLQYTNVFESEKSTFLKIINTVRHFFKMLGTPLNSYPMKLSEIEKEYKCLSSKQKFLNYKDGLKNEFLNGVTTLVQVSKTNKCGKKHFEYLNKLPIKTFFMFDLFSDSEKSSRRVFRRFKRDYMSMQKNKTDSTYIGVHPHAIWSVHKRLWRVLAKFVKRNNLVMMFPLLESEDEVEWLEKDFSYLDYLNNFFGYKKISLQKGENAVEYLNNIKAFGETTIIKNGNFLTSKELSKLAECGVNFAVSPTKNKEMFDKNSEQILRYFPQKTGLAIEGRSPLNELSNMNSSLSIEELIKYLTLYPSKMLGLSKITGSLELNKHADFNVFILDKKQKSPKDIMQKLQPDKVYILGRRIVNNGEIDFE